MKLLETQDYLLFINEKAEIKRGDYLLEKESIINVFPDYLTDLEECKKIIAYYPRTEEAKELDLPLLPNPFEEVDVEQLSHKYYFELEEKREEARKFKGQVAGHHPDMLTSREMYAAMGGFVDGYKAAQSKQFSLEDVKKAIEMAREYEFIQFGGGDTENKYTEEEIIQSLSTQQLPKEFIPEYDIVHTDHAPNGFEKVLKFKTNSEGKQELVGIYKY